MYLTTTTFFLCSIREQFKGVDADRMESLESLELGTESGRSLSSSDEVWVVPMLVISAISVSIITIYQVSLCPILISAIIVSVFRFSSSCAPTDLVPADATSSSPKYCCLVRHWHSSCYLY